MIDQRKNYKKELTNAQQDVIAETQGCLKEIAVEVNYVKECLEDLEDSIASDAIFRTDAKDILNKQVGRLQALYDSLT